MHNGKAAVADHREARINSDYLQLYTAKSVTTGSLTAAAEAERLVPVPIYPSTRHKRVTRFQGRTAGTQERRKAGRNLLQTRPRVIRAGLSQFVGVSQRRKQNLENHERNENRETAG
jgi:hypothetical protein